MAGADLDGELPIAGGGELMHDAVPEPVVGAKREWMRVQVGFDVGWAHAGAVVVDGEL
jgi:hypothetical protein